ncbi:MAG: hypothetical protein Q9P44_13850 [Anaerolineae bacterium]|nr:hypothetical protein [Anaerolineae bacterium]
MNRTQEHLDNIFNQVREYMPAVARRIIFNYALLIAGALAVSLILVPLLRNFVPPSTAATIGFISNIAWLIYGWRMLENHNKATSLYILYVRFSRERRELETTLASEKIKSEDVSEQVEAVETSAESFILAAQEQQIEPRQSA